MPRLARHTYRVSWLEAGHRVFGPWQGQRDALALAKMRLGEGRMGVTIGLDWE